MLDDGVPDDELPEDDDVVVDAAGVVVVLVVFASLFSPDDESFVLSVGGFILSE